MLFSLSFFLSFCPLISLFVSVCPFVCLFLHVVLSNCLSLYVGLPGSQSLSFFSLSSRLSLSFQPTLCLFIGLSIWRSIFAGLWAYTYVNYVLLCIGQRWLRVSPYLCFRLSVLLSVCLSYGWLSVFLFFSLICLKSPLAVSVTCTIMDLWWLKMCLHPSLWLSLHVSLSVTLFGFRLDSVGFSNWVSGFRFRVF